MLTRQKEETVSLSFRIDRRQLDYVRRLARVRSAQEDRDLGHCDLIREAVARMYPLEEEKIFAATQE